ncbi:MAG: phospho-N-acetylmuramoyl-pentapeptide-transferase [Candidatus Eremiobacteraeota bacterium]|nr:phospho-N-acetylmuramoyl-pentapeptide-transferase [Candidatus Eremiobacteraeota bacterium]
MGVTPLFAFGASLAASLGLGRPLLNLLRAISAKQTAYEDAPQSHQTKTGTPTMGGLLFLVAPVVALAFAPTRTTLALVFLVACCALIGAVDDTLGIRYGRNRGLRARTKFLLTAVAGALFIWMLLDEPGYGSPAVLGLGNPGTLVFTLLSLCAIVATTHAVNLTDGLDGLASGAIVPPLAVVAYVAFAQGKPDVATFELTFVGAVLAFLTYNIHPAKMFMGDTGSLALGAALAGGAVATGTQLLLLLIGGVFAAETLSVIIQVASYKMTKRRVFRMSPLHHHFELAGWPETKVTARFWIASVLLSLAGLAIVAVRT